MSKPKVIVGLSGGVDSSVAAYLLLQQGYEVEGMFMKNWEDDDTLDYCPAEADLKDAKSVANTLGIKLHEVNFSYEYWQRVFAHFLEEYQQGRTPNPDILCNKEIKFKEFLNHALKLGAEKIATGHWAGIREVDGHYQMTQAADQNKDQTYFLYTLNQHHLSKALFPLANLTKLQIRDIADELGLVTATKKDSTGICFVGKRNFPDFIREYLKDKPGKMVTTEGQILGDHLGLHYYTLGQRKGLFIGGVKGAPEKPWFVVAKNLTTNDLIVSQDKNHPYGLSNSLEAIDVHWVDEPIDGPTKVFAKVRYRQALQPCTIQKTSKGLHVVFDEPQFAVTPGQAIVLYRDGLCLGGATIDETDSLGGLMTEPFTEGFDHASTTPAD